MTMIELFAGIGGWSEAARMIGGITTIGFSEVSPYKNKVLELRHPGVKNYGDITTIQQLPYADILTCSFPCTGISLAGKGAGLADPNSRLWFEAARLIRQCMPRYIVIENGPNLINNGLSTILVQLASFGYDAEWTHLSGNQFAIQTRRKRLFLVAYPSQKRQSMRSTHQTLFRSQASRSRLYPGPLSPGWACRREIPQPRTHRSAHDIPNLIHRLECTGDAIIPLVGAYVLQCIKIHHSNQ